MRPPERLATFTRALLDCFGKFGARGQNNGWWEVTSNSLGRAMQYRMKLTVVEGLPPLTCEVGGKSNFETVLHRFNGPAQVMSRIDCSPSEALGVASLEVINGGNPVCSRPCSRPVAVRDTGWPIRYSRVLHQLRQ